MSWKHSSYKSGGDLCFGNQLTVNVYGKIQNGFHKLRKLKNTSVQQVVYSAKYVFTKIRDIFGKMNRSLLVAGEAG